MSDIAHFYDNEAMTGDISLADGLLATDSSLYTAVLHSLFSDARALEGDPLVAGESKRGWWGNLLADDSTDRYGSRLWLLRREKQTPEVLLRAREYAQEALAWLITDGYAKSLEVAASYPSRGLLALEVQIKLTSGALETFDFNTGMGA